MNIYKRFNYVVDRRPCQTLVSFRTKNVASWKQLYFFSVRG